LASLVDAVEALYRLQRESSAQLDSANQALDTIATTPAAQPLPSLPARQQQTQQHGGHPAVAARDAAAELVRCMPSLGPVLPATQLSCRGLLVGLSLPCTP
jgi:hypothetical protein